MDIWFKINVTVWILMVTMMIFDIALYGKEKSPGPVEFAGGLMVLFTVFSWPAYWLSLLWS